jgi:anti-sigma B factor antagonist
MDVQLKCPPEQEGASGDMIVVHFTGCKVSLDEETLHRIHDELLALADEPDESPLLLDFGNVEYLTSATLDTLVSLHRKLRVRGRHLTVGNLGPLVHEVFAVTGLDRLFDLRLAKQGDRRAAKDGRLGFATGVPGVDDDFAFTEVIDTRNQLADRMPWRRQDRWIETPWKSG